MSAEAAAPLLANMSAPPRSWVRLPRLALRPPTDPCASTVADGARAQPDPAALRAIPVGPGGGLRLSHGVRLTQLDLPCAVHAELRLPMKADLLGNTQGMARALVALARRPPPTGPDRRAWVRTLRRDVERLAATPEAELLDELCARLASVAWPAWVPRVAIAIPLGMDTATRLGSRPPSPPSGVRCPLLAARLVSAIRGPAFLRDAAPALSNLLDAWRGPVASGCWDLWLPLRPVTGRSDAGASARTGEPS